MSDVSSNISCLNLKVIHKAQEAEDIYTFDLAPINGDVLPPFTAGSHLDVHLPNGLIRQYSLCNDSNETHRYQIAVLKDQASRGGSLAMHQMVQEGEVLQVSFPRNHFSLAPEAKQSLLLAAGIGITPILCMAEYLAHTDGEFEIHYCARSPERTAFRQRIANSGFAHKANLYFSQGDNPQKLELKKLLAKPEIGCHIYVCGPQRFMEAVLTTAREFGWPESQLHYEYFNADVTSAENDEVFDIKLASSGRIISVPKDLTVTQALSAAGIDILVSCEQGVCGTCLTTIIEGIPDHRDSYLTPEEQAENRLFTPCCSRALTKQLVIDI